MTTMASEATNGAFDFSSFMVLLIVLGIAVVVLGLLACWASLREHRCFLCSYVCFAVVIGPLLLCICCGMAAYWKAEWPNLVKTTNRICGPNAPQAFEAQLNCTNPLFATQRRLETADIGPIATLRVAHSLLSEAASLDGGRRLFPGTAEESLLVRTCDRLGPELCSSPCALVDLICQTPPGYDPLKACICDQGAAAMPCGSDTCKHEASCQCAPGACAPGKCEAACCAAAHCCSKPSCKCGPGCTCATGSCPKCPEAGCCDSGC